MLSKAVLTYQTLSVCASVHMYECICDYIFICIYVHACISMYMCVHACVCVHACAYMYEWGPCISIHIHMYACMYECVHLYIYMCMKACMCVPFSSVTILMLGLGLRLKGINTHQASQYVLHSCCVQSLVPGVGKVNGSLPLEEFPKRSEFKQEIRKGARFGTIELDIK